MGKSLSEYAAQHPQEMPQAEQEQRQRALEERREAIERRRERQSVERLMSSVLSQLQQVNEPQYILYTALELIEALTGDTAWADEGRACLDSIYTDLAQQSLLTDNVAVAAAKAAQMQADYNNRLRKQLNTQLAGNQRITRELTAALKALDLMDDLNADS